MVNEILELIAIDREGQQIQFYRYPMPGDTGDCAYHLLYQFIGKHRKEIAEQLLSHANDIEIRKLLAPEILAAIKAHELPANTARQINPTDRFQDFQNDRNTAVVYREYRNYISAQSSLDDYVRVEKGRLTPEARNRLVGLEPKDLLNSPYFPENLKKVLRTNISEAKNSYERFKICCASRKIYEAYIQHYIKQPGQYLTFFVDDTSSIDAIAKLNQIDIMIWGNDAAGVLREIRHCESIPGARIIDMYFINNNHFDLLGTHSNFIINFLDTNSLIASAESANGDSSTIANLEYNNYLGNCNFPLRTPLKKRIKESIDKFRSIVPVVTSRYDKCYGPTDTNNEGYKSILFTRQLAGGNEKYIPDFNKMLERMAAMYANDQILLGEDWFESYQKYKQPSGGSNFKAPLETAVDNYFQDPKLLNSRKLSSRQRGECFAFASKIPRKNLTPNIRVTCKRIQTNEGPLVKISFRNLVRNEILFEQDFIYAPNFSQTCFNPCNFGVINERLTFSDMSLENWIVDIESDLPVDFLGCTEIDGVIVKSPETTTNDQVNVKNFLCVSPIFKNYAKFQSQYLQLEANQFYHLGGNIFVGEEGIALYIKELSIHARISTLGSLWTTPLSKFESGNNLIGVEQRFSLNLSNGMVINARIYISGQLDINFPFGNLPLENRGYLQAIRININTPYSMPGNPCTHGFINNNTIGSMSLTQDVFISGGGFEHGSLAILCAKNAIKLVQSKASNIMGATISGRDICLESQNPGAEFHISRIMRLSGRLLLDSACGNPVSLEKFHGYTEVDYINQLNFPKLPSAVHASVNIHLVGNDLIRRFGISIVNSTHIYGNFKLLAENIPCQLGDTGTRANLIIEGVANINTYTLNLVNGSIFTGRDFTITNLQTRLIGGNFPIISSGGRLTINSSSEIRCLSNAVIYAVLELTLKTNALRRDSWGGKLLARIECAGPSHFLVKETGITDWECVEKSHKEMIDKYNASILEELRQMRKDERGFRIIKGLFGSVLGFGISLFLGPQMMTFAKGLCASTGLKASADTLILMSNIGKGMVFGGVRAAVTGENIPKNLLLGGVSAGMNNLFQSMDIVSDSLKAAMAGVSNAGIRSIILNGNLPGLRDLVIEGVSSGVAEKVVGPSTNPGMVVSPLKTAGKEVMHSVVKTGTATAISGAPIKQVISNSVVSGLDAGVGSLAASAGTQTAIKIEKQKLENMVQQKPASMAGQKPDNAPKQKPENRVQQKAVERASTKTTNLNKAQDSTDNITNGDKAKSSNVKFPVREETNTSCQMTPLPDKSPQIPDKAPSEPIGAAGAIAAVRARRSRKTRIENDKNGRRVYRDHDSGKFTKSPLKNLSASKPTNAIKAEGPSINLGGSKESVDLIERRTLASTENVKGTVGLTFIGEANGSCSMGSVKDLLVKPNISVKGKASGKTNVFSGSFGEQTQMDVNGPSGQIQGSMDINLRGKNPPSVNLSFSVGAKVANIEGQVATEMHLPGNKVLECTAKGSVDFGAISVEGGFSSYKTKPGGSPDSQVSAAVISPNIAVKCDVKPFVPLIPPTYRPNIPSSSSAADQFLNNAATDGNPNYPVVEYVTKKQGPKHRI